MCSELLQLPYLHITVDHSIDQHGEGRPIHPELQLLHVDNTRDWDPIREAYQSETAAGQTSKWWWATAAFKVGRHNGGLKIIVSSE